MRHSSRTDRSRRALDDRRQASDRPLARRRRNGTRRFQPSAGPRVEIDHDDRLRDSRRTDGTRAGRSRPRRDDHDLPRLTSGNEKRALRTIRERHHGRQERQSALRSSRRVFAGGLVRIQDCSCDVFLTVRDAARDEARIVARRHDVHSRVQPSRGRLERAHIEALDRRRAAKPTASAANPAARPPRGARLLKREVIAGETRPGPSEAQQYSKEVPGAIACRAAPARPRVDVDVRGEYAKSRADDPISTATRPRPGGRIRPRNMKGEDPMAPCRRSSASTRCA